MLFHLILSFNFRLQLIFLFVEVFPAFLEDAFFLGLFTLFRSLAYLFQWLLFDILALYLRSLCVWSKWHQI